MTKQTHLTMRIPSAEATRVAGQAEAAGVSVSAWIRQALNEHARLGGALAELRSEIQAQVADLDSKLRLISDQISALSKIVAEARK
jgi:hypothetical protein